MSTAQLDAIRQALAAAQAAEAELDRCIELELEIEDDGAASDDANARDRLISLVSEVAGSAPWCVSIGGMLVFRSVETDGLGIVPAGKLLRLDEVAGHCDGR